MLVASLMFAVALNSGGPAQKPVCEVFTDAEVADVLQAGAVKKQAILGDAVCSWSATGVVLTVTRQAAESSQEVAAIMDAMQRTSPGESAEPESGLGQRAISVQGPYGRSLRLLVASGSVLWRFDVEKGDQKLDVAAVKPKLKALAKKAVG